MSFTENRIEKAFVALIIVSLLASPIVALLPRARSSDYVGTGVEANRAGSFKVSAWTFPWDKDSFASLKRWGNVLDEVSPYWYWTLSNGSVVRTHKDAENIDFVTFCRQNGVRILPMVSNNHDPDIVRSICRDPLVQQRHLSHLLNLTLMFNFDGLDINYESVRTEDREVYSNFISNLSAVLHARGKMLSVSVFPKVADLEQREGPDAYDYGTISSKADQVRIMAYNLHWSSCPDSGPIVSYPWVETVLDYAKTVVPADKIVLGVPQFSYDWRVDKNGRTLAIAENRSYSEIMKVMVDHGVKREWDSLSRTPFLEYKGDDGYLHSLHYCDMESLYHQLKLVDRYSLRGISVWKIGGEDPTSSSMMRAIKGTDLGDLPPFVSIGSDLIGKVGTPISIGPVRAYDIEGRLAFIEWDLGDGYSTDELDPVHTYSSGGFYNAVLTVEDETGNMVSITKVVKIGPYAVLRMEGKPGTKANLTFDATESWDPVGLVSYNWDLGDGTYLFHDLRTVTHSYGKPGEFRVSLTVISSEGYIDTASMVVVVPDVQPPVADAGPDLIVWEDSPVTLDGTASLDDSGGTDFHWTLSDGRILFGERPTVSFTQPGTYRVILEVLDTSGNRDTDDLVIDVRDRTPPAISLRYPLSGTLGSKIELNASSSYDNVGIEEFIWDLGGGNVIRDKVNITLDLLEARSYFVTLDVLDAEMNWNSTTVHVIALDDAPPSASLKVIPEPVPLNGTYMRNSTELNGMADDGAFLGAVLRGETYIFSLTSIHDDSEIAIINWTFGDGAFAGGPIVYHVYKGSGLYVGKVELRDVHNNSLVTDFSLLVLPTFGHNVIFTQRTNVTYLNGTVHITPEHERSPILGTGTLIMLSGAILMVAVLIIDMSVVFRSLRVRMKEWKGAREI